MLETMTIQEVRWGLWRGGFHQNGYFLVCKSCDTQSSEREVLEQKWDLEAERSDRLGGKGRKGKQGGTVVVLNQQKTIQPANSKRPFMGKGERKIEKEKGEESKSASTI